MLNRTGLGADIPKGYNANTLPPSLRWYQHRYQAFVAVDNSRKVLPPLASDPALYDVPLAELDIVLKCPCSNLKFKIGSFTDHVSAIKHASTSPSDFVSNPFSPFKAISDPFFHRIR